MESLDMAGETEFELSRSTQLNELIQLGRNILDGESRSEDFKRSLKNLNNLRRDIRRLFRSQLRFQEKTPLIEREAVSIERNLEKLRDGIDEAYRYIKYGKIEHIVQGIKMCSCAFSDLFSSFDAIKEEESKREQYSESLFQDELMRLGNGVINGLIKPEAFNEKIVGTIQYYKAFYNNLEKMEPTPNERDAFLERKPDIKKAMKNYVRGLEEAKLYFTDNDTQHIREGMRLSKEASDELIAHQKAIAAASEGPSSKMCFKCGKENHISSKFCEGCSAALPAFDQGSESSTMEFRVNEQGMVMGTNHVVTEYSKKMMDSVEKVKNNDISKEAFRKVLEELEQKALNAKKEKSRLGAPPVINEEEQSGSDLFLDAVEQLMNTGVDEILEGIERMKMYLPDDDMNHLTSGMETALCGVDKLYQVQMLTVEMSKSA